MPRFRIQSNLHLDGFQMLDACLENVTSFEGLDDKNDGRIVFLNGSSGNQSNLHPAVCYGSVFKGLAYLDDIDKITNGEGSLGTRVKALEDMLKMDDANDAINTWAEIQKFLENIDEGLDLMTMLDGKLDTKGGTINGLLYIQDTENPRIIFKNNTENLGVIGFMKKKPSVYNFTDNAWYTLLHSGNVGGYAAGGITYAAGVSAIDLNSVKITDGIMRFYYSIDNNSANTPINSGGWANSLLAIPLHTNGTTAQLFFAKGNKSGIFFRNNYDSDWKTIAFTDSDITGNAATATKLKDKVSLWGNEFDGTKDISGALYFNGISAIEGGENTLSIGWGFREKIMDIYGGTIRFKPKNVIAMTITEEGNIEIAGANNVYTRKLAVGIGSTHIISTTTGVPALGRPAANSLLVGSVHYGLQIGTDTNSEASFIQAQRFDSVDAKTLNLNPRGGAVNVGSYDSNINVLGVFAAERNIHANSGVINIGKTDGSTNVGLLYFYRKSANYIWANKEGGYLTFGVYDASGNGSVGAQYATMQIGATTIIPGYRDNAVSLGTSSYRWSDVYSVNGNFSGNVRIANDYGLLSTTPSGSVLQMIGTTKNNALFVGTDACIVNKMLTSVFGSTIRFYTGASLEERVNTMTLTSSGHVLIGGAEDDADYALNVKGDSYFGGTVYIPTGQKLTIGDANGDHATIEYDSIAKAIKVDGNLFTTGTNASGGKADDQSGNTSGGSAEVYKYDLGRGEQVYEIQNVKGDVNVNVQVYEWNENGNSWDMILTDVSVTANIITVTFGRPTSVDHMVTVV